MTTLKKTFIPMYLENLKMELYKALPHEDSTEKMLLKSLSIIGEYTHHVASRIEEVMLFEPEKVEKLREAGY